MPSHTTRANIPDEDYLLRLALCLGILLAVRLAAVHAATTDLVLDEAQYWTWSRALDFGYFSKPPMIAWVIAAPARCAAMARPASVRPRLCSIPRSQSCSTSPAARSTMRGSASGRPSSSPRYPAFPTPLSSSPPTCP